MSLVCRRWFSHALCLLLGLAGRAAVAAPEQGRTFAFAVPRAEVISTTKTIGVMPLTVTAVVPDADGVAARYESEIVTRLTNSGFSVIPPSAMREIRERTKATLGGLYDPMTGDPIKEKVNAFNEFSINEYNARYKVDAVLAPAIVRRAAEFNSAGVWWDGVDDSATGESGWAFLWKPTPSIEGTMPALSFVVRLVDPSGKVLYGGVGGLQVLAYWKHSESLWSAKERTVRIDPKFVMTDPARDARALSLALDPLLRGKVSPLPKVTRLPAATPGGNGATRLSREEVLARFPRLALASLGLEEGQQRDAVRLHYRDALTQKLTQLGFEVVGGDDYERLWDAERAAIGGFFDPFTGKPDDAKLKASRQRVFGSMQEHLAATAIVVPRVVERVAQFSYGTAEWDGVKESLTGMSGLVKFLSLDWRETYSGGLGALSLKVQIIDPTGELLFEGFGGIQLMEHYNPAGNEPLADADLFSDPAKDTRAIDVALAPLASPPPPTPR